MLSSRRVLDTKANLSSRPECFSLFSFNKCIFRVWMFSFLLQHTIKWRCFHIFNIKTAVGLWLFSHWGVNGITTWIQMLSGVPMQLTPRCPWALLYVSHLCFECYYSCLYVMGQHWTVSPPIRFPSKRPEFVIWYQKKETTIIKLSDAVFFCCV